LGDHNDEESERKKEKEWAICCGSVLLRTFAAGEKIQKSHGKIGDHREINGHLSSRFFLIPDYLHPSQKPVTCTKNIYNTERTRNIGFVIVCSSACDLSSVIQLGFHHPRKKERKKKLNGGL